MKDALALRFQEDILNGTGTPHRMVSIKIHSTRQSALVLFEPGFMNEPKGNEDRSLNVGKQSEPTTASISCCALLWASGYNIIASMKWETAVIVYPG
jgi:hypothetical protein